MSDWADKFVPFSLFHIACVAAFTAAMLGACAIGLWTLGRETPAEARFRRAWGWTILAFQAVVTIWYLDGFQWQVSLPLQLCDLAAFMAGMAMVWHRRWMRTLLYFWAIGLSTQAFFTPIVQVGYTHWYFWMFWIGHTMIIGSAVYDVVVGGYRPAARDLRLAILVSLGYVAVAMTTNLALDASGLLADGVRANYGYIGRTTPVNPTIVDRLGPWPWRVLLLMAIVIVDFVLLWAVWPLARRWTGRRDPLQAICPGCGRRRDRSPGTACPECGAAPGAVQ